MSNELATYSILALVTVVVVLAFWISLTLQGIHNTVAIIASTVSHDLEQIIINLNTIIRQNSTVTGAAETFIKTTEKIIEDCKPSMPAPKPAKVAKVQPTYQPRKKA